MTNSDKHPETKLVDAVTAIKEEPIDARAEARAAARVRTVLLGEEAAHAGALHGCAEVASLLPAYRRDELGEARRLLVEDHARECVACRQLLDQRQPARVLAMPWTAPIERAHPARWNVRTWAVAATLALAIAVGFLFRFFLFWSDPEAGRLYVQSVAGELYRVSATGQKPLAPGDSVLAAEKVRIGGGGHAVVRLADGSLVEMGERTQLAVDARGNDTTIVLDRGNIIVEAAKRSRGHLYVAAQTARVAVTGTVFSVSRGIAGSRVSVIEGEVRVAHAGRESVLHPGQQLSTGAGMEPVAVRDDIAWSRKREAHLKLLAGLAGLQKDLERVQLPGLRYGSRLMALAPADTVVYVAVPNYGEALAEAHQLLTARLAAGGPLSEWWTRSGFAREGDKLEEAVEKLRQLGTYLGDEILITVAHTPGLERGTPLLLAEVRREGVEDFLTRELFSEKPGRKGLRVRVVDAAGLELLGDSVTRNEAIVLVEDGLLAMASQPATLRRFVARRAAGGGFGASDFAQRVAGVYEDGAGVVVAFDVEHMVKADAGTAAAAMRHLVLERKDVDGKGQHQGELTFAGPRRGVAGWLAAPAPMGALGFVSPSASAVAVFLHKEPVAMLDDVLALARDGSGRKALAEIEGKLGLRLREDVASALGGEVALALDGPLLPQPAWKLILEVSDPDRFGSALERLVEAVNADAAEHGKPALQLEHEQVEDRTYHVLRAPRTGLPLEVHYAFVDGYMVAAPTRAMLTRTIETHASGQTLADSAAFRELLPSDSQPYCSGILFQNLTPLVAPLLGTLGGSQAEPGAAQALSQIAEDARPALLAVYAEGDRIRLAGTGAALGLDVGTLALPSLLRQGWAGTRGTGRP